MQRRTLCLCNSPAVSMDLGLRCSRQELAKKCATVSCSTFQVPPVKHLGHTIGNPSQTCPTPFTQPAPELILRSLWTSDSHLTSVRPAHHNTATLHGRTVG